MSGVFRQRQVQCITPSGLHQLAYTEWGDPAKRKVLLCVHGLSRCTLRSLNSCAISIIL